MREDVISKGLNGPMRETEVRELPDDRFEETLRERGSELDPIELQGSDLSRVVPNRGVPAGEEADTVSGREAPDDRSGNDAP